MNTITMFPKVNSTLNFGILVAIIKVSFSASAILPYNDLADNILVAVVCFCLTLHIITQAYGLRTLFIYGVVSLIALISAFRSGNMVILLTTLCCFAMRGQSFERIVRFIYSYECLFFVCHIVWSVISYQFFGTKMFVSVSNGGHEETGLCFGFNHKNLFGAYLFNVIIMWVWIHFEKLNTRKILTIFLISTVFYMLVHCRTSYLDEIICCIFLLYLTNSKKHEHKIIAGIAKIICPALTVIMLYMVYGYLTGNEFIFKIDEALSGRIKLGAYGITHFGPTLLGQPHDSTVVWEAEWGLTGHTYDNIYTWSVANIGWIWLIVISFCFYNLTKLKSTKINLMIILWSLYAITEVHGTNAFMNFPILLIALLLGSYTSEKCPSTVRGRRDGKRPHIALQNN